MALEWFKKNLEGPIDARRALIDADHPRLSIVTQCELLGLPRSTWYYQPVGESAENLELMRLLDEQYTERPSTEAGGWRCGCVAWATM